MAILAELMNETTERINIENRKRDKAPITYAVKDTFAFIGGATRLGSLAIDDAVQDKILDNELNKLTRLKEFEKSLEQAGYSN